jgi:very-short-patch-repair endonuclease
MSLPEVLLWIQLKARPSGLKFRKQHPFGRFVADFYCDAAKLIVEVDGIAHDMGDQPAFDAQRDAWFRSEGLVVLRIPAREILSDMDAVISVILVAADAAGPPPSVLRTATSPGGGGFALEL